MRLLLREEVIFITPNAVKNKFDKMVDEIGVSKSKSAIKYGIEYAAGKSIDKAKTQLKKKFGEKVAGAVIPYLNYFTWGYIAYDVISDVEEGKPLLRLDNAVEKNTGLIFIHQRNSYGDLSKYVYWNGATKYGKYPTAYLGPNTWQYGNVKVK